MKCLWVLMFVAISHAYVSSESGDYLESQSSERNHQDRSAYDSRESHHQDKKAYESSEKDHQDSQSYDSREKGNQRNRSAYDSREKGHQDDSQEKGDHQDRESYESGERDNRSNKTYESKEKDNEQDLPAPRLVRLTLVDDPSLAIKVEWTKVETPQGEAPIQGYKLKVWEENACNTYRYVTVNGVKQLVEVHSAENTSDNDHKPRDVIVNGPEKTSALVRGIEHGVTYKVTVQAYNRNGDGPLSQSMSIKVAPKEDNSNNKSKDVY